MWSIIGVRLNVERNIMLCLWKRPFIRPGPTLKKLLFCFQLHQEKIKRNTVSRWLIFPLITRVFGLVHAHLDWFRGTNYTTADMRGFKLYGSILKKLIALEIFWIIRDLKRKFVSLEYWPLNQSVGFVSWVIFFFLQKCWI